MTAEHMLTGALSGRGNLPQLFGSRRTGYWGVRYPDQAVNADPNQSQFCLIQSPEQGIYVAQAGPGASAICCSSPSSSIPGLIDWNGNAVPRADEISGLPVHLDFRTCHFVFAHAHSSVNLTPVVMRPLRGRLA